MATLTKTFKELGILDESEAKRVAMFDDIVYTLYKASNKRKDVWYYAPDESMNEQLFDALTKLRNLLDFHSEQENELMLWSRTQCAKIRPYDNHDGTMLESIAAYIDCSIEKEDD